MMQQLSRLWHKFRTNRRGNVLMLFGFAIIPMVFATGMGIDYSRAARLRTKLNAIADAAALAAVTQPMMLVTNDETVRSAARIMFEGQANALPGLDGAPELNIVLSHPDGANSRTATVTYTARSLNSFGGVLNMRTITIGGTSSASAAAPPNIDFYLALDTSPSMALPTTSAGFQTMDSAVKCAFACHSNKIQQYFGGSLPTPILDNAKFAIVKGNYATIGTGQNAKKPIDDKGSYIYPNNRTPSESRCKSGSKDICIYNSDGSFVDSYWYALNKGVRLRVTDERSAIADLMTLAKSYASENHRQYRAALYTFDHTTNLKTISDISPDLDAVGTLASQIDLVTVNDKKANGRPPDGSSGRDYLFTSYKSILDKMGTTLPQRSGNGTDAPGDTPQAFLFMVTDGMSDEELSTGGGRTRSAMQEAQINQCTAIKNRGVKIAILYTEYTVESIKDDEPGQRAIATAAIPHIAPALTRCASPDLMITVRTDQDISAALQTLFTRAVASAHLIQ